MAFVFDGFPRYVAEAADRLGITGAARYRVIDEAKRGPTITALSNLLAQTFSEHLESAYGVAGAMGARAASLQTAREKRDALAVAALACEAMVAEVAEHWGMLPGEPRVTDLDPTEPNERKQTSLDPAVADGFADEPNELSEAPADEQPDPDVRGADLGGERVGILGPPKGGPDRADQKAGSRKRRHR